MKHKFESLINSKISQIEEELNNLKNLISTKKNKPVSLRGMAKVLVSDEELYK